MAVKSSKSLILSENECLPFIKHFITSLLFSSPRIPFSDSQKRAVLNWAKELGAANVPSLGAMKKCHNYLDELVGSPTQKMTSRAGDVFYINNVAEAIAKVRLACLSCLFNSDITFRIMRIHLHVLRCAIILRMVARGCHRSLMARKCYSIFRHHRQLEWTEPCTSHMNCYKILLEITSSQNVFSMPLRL